MQPEPAHGMDRQEIAHQGPVGDLHRERARTHVTATAGIVCFEQYFIAGIAAFVPGVSDECGERRRVANAEVEALCPDRQQHVAGFADKRHAVGGEALGPFRHEREDAAGALDFHLAQDRMSAALDLAAKVSVVQGIQ